MYWESRNGFNYRSRLALVVGDCALHVADLPSFKPLDLFTFKARSVHGFCFPSSTPN